MFCSVSGRCENMRCEMKATPLGSFSRVQLTTEHYVNQIKTCLNIETWARYDVTPNQLPLRIKKWGQNVSVSSAHRLHFCLDWRPLSGYETHTANSSPCWLTNSRNRFGSSKIKKETDVRSKYISNVVVCISKWNKKLYSVSELLSPLFVLEEGEPVQLVFG